MARDIRATAARCLSEVMHDGKSLNESLPRALEQVAPEQRPLLQELCYGTLRLTPKLQGLLELLLQKPIRHKDRQLGALLQLGLYQLCAMDIPPHAAVSTTVDAAKALGKGWARGLTNALLRRYLREAEQLTARLTPAAQVGCPEWLYQAINSQWPQQAAAIIDAGNLRPPMTLRVNALQSSVADYLAQLDRQGIGAQASHYASFGITLDQACPVTGLPGFAEGHASVQDEAAQLAAELVDAQAGMKILDACAAPGGKSCHILESTDQIVQLVAMDVDPQRLMRVQENLERLQLSAELLAGDARTPPAELEPSSFDCILIDAPCSASGVIRRHPDIKCLRRESDIGSFAQTQLDILQGCWPLLRPGGAMVYATCSLLEQENDGVIAQFLALENTASVQDLARGWGIATRYGRQLLPTATGPDGLYYCRLQRSPTA